MKQALILGLICLTASMPSGKAAGTEIRLLAQASITSQTAAGPTHPAAMSWDGRFVLLRSDAPNLIAGQVDHNGAGDLFLRDRTKGELTLITHAADLPSTTADAGSWPVAMSPDGEFVLFTSWANNLIAGMQVDAAFASNAYLWRRSDLSLRLVSHLAGEMLHSAGSSRAVAMTADGAFVLFDSDATGLVAGVADNNQASDVFLYAAASGEIVLVSGNQLGTGNGPSTAVAVLSGGSAILFDSSASDLVPGDTNQRLDAFWHQVDTGSTSLIVSRPEGSIARAITPDGRYILLDTPDDRVLVFDRELNQVKVIASGSQAMARAISDDGRRVLYDHFAQAYLSSSETPAATCLSCSAPLGGEGISLSGDGRFALYWQGNSEHLPIPYLYDSENASTTSLLPPGTQGIAAGGGFFIGLSGDHRFLVLAAGDAGLLPSTDDRNGNYDTFVIERGVPGIELSSASAWPGPIATTLGNASSATGQSATGEEILFSGPAYLLDPANPNPHTAAWAYDIGTRELKLLSPLPGQPEEPASGWSRPLALARDGRALLASTSPDLLPGSSPFSAQQIFLYTASTGSYSLITRQALSPAEGTAGFIDEIRFTDELSSQVYFRSTSADLVAGLAPLSAANLFSCDLQGAGCALLSVDAENSQVGADAGVEQVRVASHADVVVFSSPASNLITGDSRSQSNAYAFSGPRGLELLSHAFGDKTRAANGPTWTSGISADGRFVVVTSWASDLDPNVLDLNGTADVYVYDSQLGAWELASSNALNPNLSAGGYSRGLTISADGRYVLFFSGSTDLVPGQIDAETSLTTDAPWDLFLYDRSTRQKWLVSHLPGQPLNAAGYAYFGYLSSDGSRVAFQSISPSLNPGRPSGTFGLFLWDSAVEGPQTLYQAPGGPYPAPGAWPIFYDRQYFDGSLLPFGTFAGNAAPQRDTNGFADAFVVLLDPLFRDGFESGDTSRWSSTLPEKPGH